uniref:Uncharacterized protein n=1 Tax=Candidatus Kentrum sp. SD TaxID=2126332 RepID=A0A450Y591_9GAMM|nr:MAG: hypothetical protein BECKSD772F_GA0070984_100428 [Candidatus Kentron sp. SD]VFK40227.1 MAG: hypothetical protein BECKSD772E_GA0070983_100528 [Candidatus Kentron sp. SD]
MFSRTEDNDQRIMSFGFLCLDIIESLTKGTIDASDAIRIFFHAGNCRFVRMVLQHEGAASKHSGKFRPIGVRTPCWTNNDLIRAICAPCSLISRSRSLLNRFWSSSSGVGTWTTLTALRSPLRYRCNNRSNAFTFTLSVLARRLRRFTSMLDESTSEASR